jgi:hypothetical protein
MLSRTALPTVVGIAAGLSLLVVKIFVGVSLDRYGRPPYSTTNFQIIDEPDAFRDDDYGYHGLDDVATVEFSDR